MFVVTARKKISSLGVKVDSATEALQKIAELAERGFEALVMDIRGRELTREQLEAQAADERREVI